MKNIIVSIIRLALSVFVLFTFSGCIIFEMIFGSLQSTITSRVSDSSSSAPGGGGGGGAPPPPVVAQQYMHVGNKATFGFTANPSFAHSFVGPVGSSDIYVDTVSGTIYYAKENAIEKYSLSTGANLGGIGETSFNWDTAGTCLLNSAQTGWCMGAAFVQMGGSLAVDGTFVGIKSIAVDRVNNALYVFDGAPRIQKFNLTTGAYIGTIGRSTVAAGTCLLGTQSSWCSGGDYAEADFISVAFDSTLFMGGFSNPTSLFYDSTTGRLYVGDGDRSLQIINSSNGAFVSSLAATMTQHNGWEVMQGNQLPAMDFSFSYYFMDIQIDSANDFMYVLTGPMGINKMRMSTGELVGSIGYSMVTSGTCVTGMQAGWCTGGVMMSAGSGDGDAGVMALDTANNIMYVGAQGKVSRHVLSTGAFVGSIGETTGTTGTCTGAGVETNWCTGGTFNQRGSADLDGGFGSINSIAYNPASGTLYIAESTKISVYFVNATSATFLGSIGNTSSSTGSCAASGAQAGWCTGGVFTNGSDDGMFQGAFQVKLDPDNNFLFVYDSQNYRIQKFNLTTGAFIGAIGNTSSSTGSCAASGAQAGWCTGGVFTGGNGDGMFATSYGGMGFMHVDTDNNELLVADTGNSRIQKFNLATGAYIGSIGYTATATGTCAAGVQSAWCTGGSFLAGVIDGSFMMPMAIARDPATGYIFVSGGYLARIDRIIGL